MNSLDTLNDNELSDDPQALMRTVMLQQTVMLPNVPAHGHCVCMQQPTFMIRKTIFITLLTQKNAASQTKDQPAPQTRETVEKPAQETPGIRREKAIEYMPAQGAA